MLENILWFLLAGGVLFLIIGIWFGIHYWLNPQVEGPDGKGRITGNCGDTMEICLKFQGDRVVDASHWTNGCTYSLNCVCAASKLALGKTPDQILEIDANRIRDSIGGLPSDQMHCARLAEETLQAALDHFMLNRKN